MSSCIILFYIAIDMHHACVHCMHIVGSLQAQCTDYSPACMHVVTSTYCRPVLSFVFTSSLYFVYI